MSDPKTPSSPRETGQDLVSIVEAINATTREVYVGITHVSLERLARAHAKERPYAIAHWKARQRISYQYVEYAVKEAQAAAFIKRYLRSSRKPGWTFVTDETSAPHSPQPGN